MASPRALNRLPRNPRVGLTNLAQQRVVRVELYPVDACDRADPGTGSRRERRDDAVERRDRRRATRHDTRDELARDAVEGIAVGPHESAARVNKTEVPGRSLREDAPLVG